MTRLSGSLISALGAALCAAAFVACHNPAPEDAEERPLAYAGGHGTTASGPVLVTGTAIEARSGKPLANVRILGPGGVETKSDERGRFVLRGLAPGASGELVGTTESGLSGRNPLRSLSGALEVVLYLR